VSRVGRYLAALAMLAYAAFVLALSIPSVLNRSLLWQFSLTIIVIVSVPTAVIGVLTLVPVYRRSIALLALVWMAFVTLGWVSSNLALAIISAAVTTAVGWSVVERFRAAAVEKQSGGGSAKT
jgi:hypothetical protein